MIFGQAVVAVCESDAVQFVHKGMRDGCYVILLAEQRFVGCPVEVKLRMGEHFKMKPVVPIIAEHVSEIGEGLEQVLSGDTVNFFQQLWLEVCKDEEILLTCSCTT